MRVPFVWRLSILTLVAALLGTVAIFLAIERVRERAAQTAYEITAARRIVAELSGPLSAVTAAAADDATRTAFERAGAEARRFDDAAGIRIYRSDGRAIFPADAPPPPAAVQAELAGTDEVRVEGETAETVYERFARGSNALIVAEDFVSVRVVEDTRPTWQVLGIAGVVSAVLATVIAVMAAGASYEIGRRRRNDQTAFVHTLALMAEALELRDPYTAGHSQRVAAYSRRLATALGLPARDIDVIEGAALLHDIGKMGVPDPVLYKPGPLDDLEWRRVAQHPALGARLLRGVAAMSEVIPCVLHHHERIDGLGYPDQLRGEQIPLGARVIAIADTFDAMTTDRPYRAATTCADAVRELRRVEHKQLDANLVERFIALVDAGDIVPPAAVDSAKPSAT